MDLINASRELIIAQTQKPDENKEELGNVGGMTQATTQVQVETMGKMTPSEREIAVADFCHEGWLFRPKPEKGENRRSEFLGAEGIHFGSVSRRNQRGVEECA